MRTSHVLLVGVLLAASGIQPSLCQVLTGQGEPRIEMNVRSGGGQDGSFFIFRKEVEEVVLNVSVQDGNHQPVDDLRSKDFTILENGQPQKITSFRHDDIPVAMGLIIDSSASMIEIRSLVNQAALVLVEASNDRDQVFIVNFNEHWRIDQDFTSDTVKLRRALEQVEFRGGTALYDAVRAAAQHRKTNDATPEKKVLIVVTDGEDNMSDSTLYETAQVLAAKDGPIVYTIGLLHGENRARLERALRVIAESTGGIAYIPKDVGEVNAISMQVARDIRSQYTISYKPTTSKNVPGYRTIRVDVTGTRDRKLTVRTRTGYFPTR